MRRHQKITVQIILAALLASITITAQIVNPDKPLKGKWDLDSTEVWSIDKVGGEPFFRPVKMKLGEDGRLYIFDYDHFKFFVIDPETGALIQAFGRKGSGPGEISFFNDFYPLADRFIVYGYGRIHYYDSHNNYAYLHSVTLKNSISIKPLLFLDPDRYISIPQNFNMQKAPKGLVLHDIPSGSVTPIAGNQSEKKNSEDNDLDNQAITALYYASISPQLLESIIITQHNGRIYFGSNGQYDIHIIEADGKEAGSFSIAERKRIQLPKEAQAVLKTTIDEGYKAYPSSAKRKVHKHFKNGATYFFQIHVDSRGMIYVFTCDPQDRTRQSVDIFSPEGKYLYQAEIPIPKGLSPLGDHFAFYGNTFFVFFQNKNAEFILKKYQVRLPE